MSSELRALANEYGLEKLVGMMQYFKTDDPVQIEKLLKLDRAYGQKKIEKENENVGEIMRNSLKKKSST